MPRGMGSLGTIHWLITLAVVVLIFSGPGGGGFGSGNGLLARFRWRNSERPRRD